MKRVLLLLLLLLVIPAWAKPVLNPLPSPRGSRPHPASPALPHAEPLVPYQLQTKEAEAPPPIQLPAPQLWPLELREGPLTADEAARLALYHQANVTIAAHQVEVQKGATQVARAPYFPSLTLSTTYSDNLYNNRQGTTSTISTGVVQGSSASNTSGLSQDTSGGIIGAGGVSVSNPVTVSANLRQMIWDFNHTRYLVAQSKELEAAAAANYTQVQYDTIYNVKNTYYAWVQSDRLVTVFRANMAAQQQHLAEARARFGQGVALASDVTRAQTTVSESVLNLTQAEVNATVARTNLSNQIGIDPRIPLLPADSHEKSVEVADPNELYSIALIKRPELAFAEASIRASDYGVHAARTGNAPVLSANLQYVAFGQGFYPNQSTLNFLVTLSWNPFDGGLTAGRVKQAEENLVISRAQLEGYRNRVMTEVSQAYVNLRGAELRVSTAALQVASAQETVNINAGRYRAGLGTFLEVVDAQAAALQAMVNQVNAELNLEQQKAALNHALGVPLVEVFTVPPRDAPGIDIRFPYVGEPQVKPED